MLSESKTVTLTLKDKKPHRKVNPIKYDFKLTPFKKFDLDKKKAQT
jgi:hypothetical protein